MHPSQQPPCSTSDSDSDHLLLGEGEPDFSEENFEVPGGGSLRVRTFDFHPKNANAVWRGNGEMMVWIDEHMDLFTGRHILELGTATGLLAMFLALRGLQISTSDCETDGQLIAENVEYNFKLNGLEPPAHFLSDWGDPFPFPEGNSAQFQVILVNDCLIYVSAYTALVNTLRQLLGAPDSICILGARRRLKNSGTEAFSDFFDLLTKSGFSFTVVGSRIWSIQLIQ